MRSDIDKSRLGYRKKSNAVVINAQNKVLLLQLSSYGQNHWNTPGGGINKGESPEEAILRELGQELGTNKFEIIEKSKIIDKYNWPDPLIIQEIEKGNKYKGQEQIQFIVRFNGNETDINIQKKEVRRYKWVNYDDLKSHLIFPGQWQNIKKVIGKSSVRDDIVRG